MSDGLQMSTLCVPSILLLVAQDYTYHNQLVDWLKELDSDTVTDW